MIEDLGNLAFWFFFVGVAAFRDDFRGRAIIIVIKCKQLDTLKMDKKKCRIYKKWGGIRNMEKILGQNTTKLKIYHSK